MSKLATAIERANTAVSHIKAGKMVVLFDNEQRENEGDLVVSGSLVNAEKINFMARYARGLICLSLPPTKIKQLGLTLVQQASIPNNPRGTAFTISIDARAGVSTGISAADRATTILLACSATATAADFVAPGHVFPLRARAGGVLERGGHTEGASDLVKLAELPAGAVICEIMNEDGTMARLPDLQNFAQQHGLYQVCIEDIVSLRKQQVQNREQHNTAKDTTNDADTARHKQL